MWGKSRTAPTRRWAVGQVSKVVIHTDLQKQGCEELWGLEVRTGKLGAELGPIVENLESWEQTLQRESPVLFLWVASLMWARPTPCSLDHWSLWSWKQHGTSIMVYFPPRLITVTADPPWIGQNWGRCDGNKTWIGAETVGWEHRPLVMGGTFKDEYCVLKKVLLNFCSKF